MNKKIIFSGGGTGGHIFPAINLMKHFIDRGYEVILVTDKRGRSFIKNYPGLFLAGSAYRGIGIPDCIQNGNLAAESALKFVNGKSP